MIRITRFFCLSLFFFVSSASGFGEDGSSAWSQVRAASPVFEEMLANQIASFRRTLTPNKSNQEENSFFVITKPEPSEFSKAVSLLNESKEESFVVALAFQSERAQWESTAEKSGLSLADSVSIPELEFAKDEAGRQVVDLDDPKYEYQIYERLVREGMNPVLAHPEASEAIRRLRRMTEVQILFFSAKNVQKSAKNP